MTKRVMTRLLASLSLLLLILAVARAGAVVQSIVPARLTPDDLRWTQSGCAQQATIAGESTGAGLYATRARFAAGCKVQPHFHTNDRIVVVLSGTLYVGYGTHFDETALKALPAGSVFTEPARQPHYVWAKDGEVVFQATGIGPLSTTQIQP